MCEKTKYHNTSNIQIDKCMRNLIYFLKGLLKPHGAKILACCCGHSKYPMTILVKCYLDVAREDCIWDCVSDKLITRTRNFYKRDKKGYYYIPEVSKPKK